VSGRGPSNSIVFMEFVGWKVFCVGELFRIADLVAGGICSVSACGRWPEYFHRYSEGEGIKEKGPLDEKPLFI